MTQRKELWNREDFEVRVGHVGSTWWQAKEMESKQQKPHHAQLVGKKGIEEPFTLGCSTTEMQLISLRRPPAIKWRKMKEPQNTTACWKKEFESFNKRRGGWVGPMKDESQLQAKVLTSDSSLEKTWIWREFFEPFNKQRGWWGVPWQKSHEDRNHTTSYCNFFLQLFDSNLLEKRVWSI